MIISKKLFLLYYFSYFLNKIFVETQVFSIDKWFYEISNFM